MGEGLIVRRGGSGKSEGQFVWEKLTAEGGEFVDYVVADVEDSYPNGGELDGYWYEVYETAEPMPEQGIFLYGLTSNYPQTLEITLPAIPNSYMATGYANYSVFYEYIKKLTINTTSIGEQAFEGTFKNVRVAMKIKLKVTSIKTLAFKYISSERSKASKIWIASSCTSISMTSNSDEYSPFYGSYNGMKLYCEATAKPSGFPSAWNAGLTVTWGVTEEQFDAL